MTIDKHGRGQGDPRRSGTPTAPAAKALERRTYEDMLRSYRDEIARLEKHNEQLRAQMDLIDYTIARLPINVEELYRPMPKPDRSVAHSGRRTKRG